MTGYTVPFEITVPDGWETDDGADLGKDDPDLPNEWNVFLIFYPATVCADGRMRVAGRARPGRSDG